MKSLKCTQCGLVNFAGVTVCKRCNVALSEASLSSMLPANTAKSATAAARSGNQSSTIQPSFISIVKNDFLAFIGIILPVVFWGLFVAVDVFGLSLGRRGREISNSDGDSTFLYLAIGATILGIALLAWRVVSFQKVFADGQEVVGQITNVSFIKDRGRIDYSYRINGQTYQSGNGIMKNQKTQSFREGDAVELIVVPSNPSRAFVKELYS
jgi:hypothetical protein